jgi:hypothetical protein
MSEFSYEVAKNVLRLVMLEGTHNGADDCAVCKNEDNPSVCNRCYWCEVASRYEPREEAKP